MADLGKWKLTKDLSRWPKLTPGISMGMKFNSMLCWTNRATTVSITTTRQLISCQSSHWVSVDSLEYLATRSPLQQNLLLRVFTHCDYKDPWALHGFVHENIMPTLMHIIINSFSGAIYTHTRMHFWLSMRFLHPDSSLPVGALEKKNTPQIYHNAPSE